MIGTAQEDRTSPQPGESLVYVGTYTGPSSQGVYLYRFDARVGALTPAGLAGEAVNPSFLAIHLTGRFLYAVNEVGELGSKPGGAVTAFGIDPATGRLTELSQRPTGGADPCHVTIDRTGAHVLVANYSGGSVAVFPIGPDGRIGGATAFIQHHGSSVNPRRQKGPHAHGIYLDATGRSAFVPDLGLDKVMIYRFSADSGKLDPNEPAWLALPPGAGPRHMAFHPDGRSAYLINELHSTIDALALDAGRGALAVTQTVSTLPAGFAGQSTTAEIAVHPNGQFLYGSNRGHDSIAVFAIEAATGRLTGVQHATSEGKEPRHFAIDPSGQWLLVANQKSNSLVVFRIDPSTGRLTAAGSPVDAPSPVCVQWLARP